MYHTKVAANAPTDDKPIVTADPKRSIDARKAALNDTQRAIFVAYVRAGVAPLEVLANLEADMARGWNADAGVPVSG